MNISPYSGFNQESSRSRRQQAQLGLLFNTEVGVISSTESSALAELCGVKLTGPYSSK
jgi:hypothetical protein